MPNNLVFNNVANELKTQIYGTTSTGTLTPVLVGNDGAITIRNLSSATDTVSVTGNVSVVGTVDIRHLASATDTVTVTGAVDVVNVVNIRSLASATDTVSVTGNVSVVGTVDIRHLASATDTVTVTGAVDVVNVVNIRALASATDTVTVTGQVSVIATNLDIRDLSAATDSVLVTGIVEIVRDVATVATGVSAISSGLGTMLTQDTSGKHMYSYYLKNSTGGVITALLQVSPTTTTGYFVDDDTAVGIQNGQAYVFVPKHYLNYTRISYNAASGGDIEAYYNAQS